MLSELTEFCYESLFINNSSDISVRKKKNLLNPPGLDVFFPKDSLIWLDEPTS